MDYEIECCVKPVEGSLDDILKRVAISPVSDGSKTIEFIKKYIK